MKILETMMLLFQYAYYVMREWDKRAGMPASFSKFKAPVIFFVVEMWLLVAIYLLIDRVVLGQPFHELPSSMSPLIAAFAFAFVACYINIRIIGRESRIHHYKEIFDSWDQGKRLRWKILVISIAILSLAAFYVVGEISQNGLAFQNWK